MISTKRAGDVPWSYLSPFLGELLYLVEISSKSSENGWLEDDPSVLGCHLFWSQLLVSGRVAPENPKCPSSKNCLFFSTQGWTTSKIETSSNISSMSVLAGTVKTYGKGSWAVSKETKRLLGPVFHGFPAMFWLVNDCKPDPSTLPCMENMAVPIRQVDNVVYSLPQVYLLVCHKKIQSGGAGPTSF